MRTLAERPQPSAAHIRSLLIVDDSATERDLLSHAVHGALPDVEMLQAANAEEARRLCKERAFDCVILDYNMPDVDGVQLARELRAAEAYLPIILMTSVGDEMLASEALHNGASDYIPKSRITTDALRRIVDRAIRGCQQAQVIDQQRNELETFAYALAHDFKQPIRQIATFTQMISQEIREGATEDLHQHLNFLRDAAKRLGSLVDVMSQYTLLNQAPELTTVELGQILANIEDSIRPLLAERDAELTLPQEAHRLQGNEALMTQVLQNLIVNGLQYNRSSNPKVDVTAHCHNGYCEIDVRDNGIGIAPEYLAEVFKPLVRLHTASESPGSGLGLTLARKAILAQGGSICCESAPGRGSTFHVRIPTSLPVVD